MKAIIRLTHTYAPSTQVQSLWLSAITAQVALDRNDPNAAIKSLQIAAPPLEYGEIAFQNNLSSLYTACIRGNAYLAAGRGEAAVTEFHKIATHPGVVWDSVTGATPTPCPRVPAGTG